MGSMDPDPDSDPDETAEESTADHSDNQFGTLSRRVTLASLVGLGGLGLTSSTASAGKVKTWKKDRDANGQKLLNLGALAMQANETEISSFEGSGLTIDENGVLNATVTADTRTNISDDGSRVVSNTQDINFARSLAVSNDGDGSVTVDAATGTGASVGLSTEQTVVQDESTKVEFDQVEYDDNDEFDTGIHAFVPDVDGTYQVESALGWGFVTPGVSMIHRIVVNDGTRAETSTLIEGIASTFVSRVVKLTAGDEVTIEVIFIDGNDMVIDPSVENSYATFTRLR